MNIAKHQPDIDSCRFCFMCRHVCSIARITNQEGRTPRIRALMLSMILRGAESYSMDIAESVYQCGLCQYCKEWCEGGWDLPSAIRAARVDLVKLGLVPEVVKNIKESLIKFDNPYNQNNPIFTDLQEEILKYTTAKAKTLLLFGSSTLFLSQEIGLSAINIFKRAKVDFMVFKEETTSANELFNLGYVREAKEKALSLIENIKKSNCQEIVVLSGSLHYLLTEGITKLELELGNIKIYHISEFLLKLIHEGKIELKKSFNKKIIYHESDYLARYSKLYDVPRKLLEKIKGANLTELRWNKEKARSVGSALLKNTYPKLASELLKSRIEEIIEADVNILITSSAEDKNSFNNSPYKPSNLKVIDIVELIDYVT